jgi:hypothetical protein
VSSVLFVVGVCFVASRMLGRTASSLFASRGVTYGRGMNHVVPQRNALHLTLSFFLAYLSKVLVVAEQSNGNLASSSLNAIGAAKKLGGDITTIVFGSNGKSAAEVSRSLNLFSFRAQLLKTLFLLKGSFENQRSETCSLRKGCLF